MVQARTVARYSLRNALLGNQKTEEVADEEDIFGNKKPAESGNGLSLELPILVKCSRSPLATKLRFLIE